MADGSEPDHGHGNHGDGDHFVAHLDGDTASRYARTGLDNVAREYPNQPSHLLTGPQDLVAPSQLHPIFYGSYDWHSSVHQHWMLVRLLRRFPDLPEAEAIRERFDEHLTMAAAEVEADYLRDPARRAWERPYGWAWLMALAAELDAWARADHGEPEPRPDVDHARVWAVRLAPLVEVVRSRCLEWLTTARYPHRVGTHPNSAFAAMLLHDAATTIGDDELRTTIAEVATRWYGDDAGYPAWIEPSGSDFLSPALVEAELMARVLPRERFAGWFHGFLPDPSPLERPAEVTDRDDPQVVHLDGLNLSRAWAWLHVARTLGDDDPLADAAITAVTDHADASLPAVLSGAYVGEHWLPTFAVYLVDVAERR